MKVTLKVSTRKSMLKRVVLHSDVLIGRGSDCNLRIVARDVSRRHCQLVVSENKVWIRDLESSNGTFLDGEKISANEDVPLPTGSRLEIGPVRIDVNYEAPLHDDADSSADVLEDQQPDVPESGYDDLLSETVVGAIVGQPEEEMSLEVDDVPQETQEDSFEFEPDFNTEVLNEPDDGIPLAEPADEDSDHGDRMSLGAELLEKDHDSGESIPLSRSNAKPKPAGSGDANADQSDLIDDESLAFMALMGDDEDSSDSDKGDSSKQEDSEQEGTLRDLIQQMEEDSE